uniref:Uncharacterized protein n=1 Tax=Rhizophora mucronata TaxID=61149 RepID=A0A2P2QQU4_RHIMU
MYNNRRRERGDAHRQGTRSNHRKPPHGSWQPTVPSWEKRFCYLIGSVPWRKLLETKRSMYLYENVVQWNDSAGEEAFHNAKNRFWAEINGLPCNISLPDPDKYIDEIDWECTIDPELLLDLEQEPKDSDERDEGEEVVILGSGLLLNQSFSCNGWGEAEEDLDKAANLRLDHGYKDANQKMFNDEKHWETNADHTIGDVKDFGWENCWNNTYRWHNNANEWNNLNGKAGGDWGEWDGNGRKREGTGCYMSRFKTSRFQGYQCPVDHGGWRNGRGRNKANLLY